MNYKEIGRRSFLKIAAAGAAWTRLAPLGAIGGASAANRMDSGAPSETAFGAAKQRAAHQILEYPRVLDDPYALSMLGPGGEAALRAVLPRYQLPAERGMRAAIVLRSRYADDRFGEAVRSGVRQYVVLGAGLDTFAYRNQYPDSLLKIFEVDHPATQTWKRARLLEMDIPVPPSLAFAPVDFERESLADRLVRAGFRRDQPAFFSWLGVVLYLSEGAVMDTLRYVESLAPKSEVVFDFSLPAAMLNQRQQHSRTASEARAAKLGEPWVTFFEPSALMTRLQAMRFAQTTLLTPREANLRYFDGRADGLRVSGVHLMAARV